MQRKQEVTRFSVYALLDSDAIKFVLANRNGVTVHKSAVRLLCKVAIDPAMILRGAPFPPARALAELYVKGPDLVPALLVHLRAKWNKLHATKAGRLLLFMAENPFMQPADTRTPYLQADFRDCGVRNSGLTDCQVATAYEKKTGECVTVADVVKARKALLKRYADSDNAWARHCDQGGNIC